MSDFDLFKQAMLEYNENNKPKDENDSENENDCEHGHIITENGINICTLCGEEVSKATIDMEKEWRYYGVNDSKHSSDPNRCQIRKVEQKNIYKDVENMGFSEKVVSLANNLYFQVTKDKIYRGNSRKAIVFGCIMNAYKELGQPQSFETLQKIFKLERKVILKGIKLVNLNLPKNMELHGKYITPIELINEIMESLNATPQQVKEVVDIYNKVKNKSPIINKSKPQSIASGVIYYYIVSTNRKIDMKDFLQKVNLSETTIVKICTEIEKIVKNLDVI